jgi:hypothetical protein
VLDWSVSTGDFGVVMVLLWSNGEDSVSVKH